MSCSGKKFNNGPDPLSLPAHSVRVSSRARRIGLRVLPGKGLEVVLPRNADPAYVPVLLTRHRAWIEKHLKRMPEPAPGSGAVQAVPERVLLKGGQEEVAIRLSRPNQADRADRTERALRAEAADERDAPFGASPSPSRRELFLAGDSPAALLHRLREWTREEARRYLGDMLQALANKHGFAYSGLGIRFQRSRWGSCSAKGNISLNACLIFLPERLTRHILLHELCHTRQLNHSPEFWKQLFAVAPDALTHDKAMRHAWRHVPAWVFA